MSEEQRVHRCPCGCGNPDIPRRLLACPDGWRRLPEPLQNAVLRARRGSGEHMEAIIAALEWYRADRAERASTS